MPTLDLDFSSVQDYDVLDSGEYPVVVKKVVLRDSKSQPGEKYLNWDLEITDGDAEGRHLFFMTSLKANALWRLKAVFENLGIFQEHMALEVDEETGEIYGPELSGLVGLASVSQEVYEKKLQNKVDDLLPLGEEIETPPPPPAPKAPPSVVRSGTPATPPKPPTRPATPGTARKLNVQ